MHTRLAVLVDGFNLFHSIKSLVATGAATNAVKWLDLWALSESFKAQVSRGERVQLVSVDYFSAFASHKRDDDPNHVIRHQVYLRALRNTGVKYHMHRFSGRDRDCKACGKKIRFHEEKETDVAIAIKLLRIFVEDAADYVVVVSGDTDLTPAVKATFEMFPGAMIGFAFPFARKSKELEKLVHQRGCSFKLSEASYLNHSLPDPFDLKRGGRIYKPPEWA
jgi:uncharacterized LabA/DUF88 family protein